MKKLLLCGNSIVMARVDIIAAHCVDLRQLKIMATWTRLALI
jgi:hypothetical protein